MFTVAQRTEFRNALEAMARRDAAVIGAAWVGSSATDQQDAYSDIDLALQLDADADEVAAVERWSADLYANFGVVYHFDVYAGNGVRYRVFITAESLQIDISFWPKSLFQAVGDRFRLIFGVANEPRTPSAPDIDSIIGNGVLYAIHARSTIGRGKVFLARGYLDELISTSLTLASIREGLHEPHGRKVDLLPTDVLSCAESARASSTDESELRRSHAASVQLFLSEVERIDTDVARALVAPLVENVQ